MTKDVAIFQSVPSSQVDQQFLIPMKARSHLNSTRKVKPTVCFSDFCLFLRLSCFSNYLFSYSPQFHLFKKSLEIPQNIVTGLLVFPGTIYLSSGFSQSHFCLDQHTDLCSQLLTEHRFSQNAGHQEVAILRREISLLESSIFGTEPNVENLFLSRKIIYSE